LPQWVERHTKIDDAMIACVRVKDTAICQSDRSHPWQCAAPANGGQLSLQARASFDEFVSTVKWIR